MKKSILSDSDKKFIEKNYPSYGLKFCAENLNVPTNSVKGYCKKHKIFVALSRMMEKNKNNIKTAQEARRLFPEKLKVNPIPFVKDYTPETVYILGLLWADGYINSKKDFIRIEALESDLSNVAHIFKHTGDWRIRYRNRKNRRYQMIIETNNKMICNHLKECDYVEKSEKSACKILQLIPTELKKYWFRGLVDGDGCFYVNDKYKIIQFSLTSSYEQDWTYFEELLRSLEVGYKIKRRIQVNKKTKKENKNSIIRITSKYDIKILSDYLYDNNPIGFDRKRKKVFEYFNGVQV